MARISTIKSNDIANGKGIVVSVWFQGCPFHCKGCHNPQTWDFNEGEEFTQEHIDKVLGYIEVNNIDRNLSILGGESLCPPNIEGTLELCKAFKEKYPNKIIYLWTGYVVENFNELQLEILKYIDVLIDGRFEIDKKDLSLKFRGSSNQRVIDVKKTLTEGKIILYKE